MPHSGPRSTSTKRGDCSLRRKPQDRSAAFYALALDSCARLGELCGVKWSDLDFDAGTLTIMRQLLSAKLTEEGQPDFGPTKRSLEDRRPQR